MTTVFRSRRVATLTNLARDAGPWVPRPRAAGEDAMFGWRKRIGYIAPTVIEVVAYEYYRFAPDGVGLIGVTCSIDDWRPAEFEKGLAQVAAAATYLGSRGVDYIIHGGGPLVVARGAGFEELIVRDI